MLDVIIMACGSLEAAMTFCALNGVAISDVPVTGTVYQVPAPDRNTDAGVLRHYKDNVIVIGNLGTNTLANALLNEDGQVLLNEDGTPLLNEN